MSIEWYIGFDGQVVGPVDQQQLLDFLKSSEQWRQILVWHVGLDEWQLAKDIPDIAPQIAKGPPPLPAPLPTPAPTPAPKSEAPSIVPAAPAEATPAETKPPEVEAAAAPVETVAAPTKAVAAPAAVMAAAPVTPPPPSAAAAMPAGKPARQPRRWGWSATAATILVLMGGAFVAQQLSRKDSPTVAKATQPSSDTTIERGFADIVQNTTLPKKLDDWTTRSDVTQAGKRLVFHHILDTTRYLVPPNFAIAMKQKILPEACTPAAREALKAGGSLEYRFHSQAAFLIGSFEISGNDCGGEQPKG